MPAPLLRLENLEKRFGEVRALGPLDVELEPGAWGLLGPNGSGKTTLILTMLGVLHPSAGSARVLGLDPTVSSLEIRGRVGFVAFCGQLCGMKRADALGRAHEVLDYVGLGEARYRKVSEYSTGMRQRAKLAAAIVHDPGVLVLDEPTNGLDPAGRKEMIHLLRELAHDHRIPILYASHVLPDVEAVCDKLLILDKGRVRFMGHMRELLAEAERTYDVSVRGDALAFVDLLRAAGAQVVALDRTSFRVTLPAPAREDLVLRAAVEGGAHLRSLRQVARDLEAGFASTLTEASA